MKNFLEKLSGKINLGVVALAGILLGIATITLFNGPNPNPYTFSSVERIEGVEMRYYSSFDEMAEASDVIAVGTFTKSKKTMGDTFSYDTLTFKVSECFKGGVSGKIDVYATRAYLITGTNNEPMSGEVTYTLEAPIPGYFEPDTSGTEYLIFLRESGGQYIPVGHPWATRLGASRANPCVELTVDGGDISVTARGKTKNFIYEKTALFVGAAEGLPEDFISGTDKNELLDKLRAQ